MNAAGHTPATKYVGQAVSRVEDYSLLTGKGIFGDDAAIRPGTLHAAIVRSPHAHAHIISIDASTATSMPGVHAVLTGEDVRAWSRPFVVGVKAPMEMWALALDKARYAGEAVAVVVAENRYLAEDAAEHVKVHYEPLPAVSSIAAAIADDAPILHEQVGSNVVSDRHFSYGDPDQAFAAAAHTISLDVEYPRNSCTPMETSVVLAEYQPAEEAYDVMSNFMGPFSLHTVMALALRVPGVRLRHRTFRDSGGSFGVKHAVFQYAVLMCLASRKAGRPVKWVEDRLEHLGGLTSSTGRKTHISAAVDANGKIHALAYDQLDDCGAYLRAPEPASLYRMHGCMTGAYDIQNLKIRNRVVMSNKTPAGLVRGFGGPQVYFALERLIQHISLVLQLDIREVYRANFIPADAFPYQAPAGALIDSGNYQQALELADSDGRLERLFERRRAARAENRIYGIGFAAIVEPSISNMGYIATVLDAETRTRAGPKNGAIASATISIDPLGGVSVVIASAPAGQGHRTASAQVVADVLGLSPEQINVNVEFDTHKDAWSVAAGNYSSRFAGAVAGTVHLAAIRLRDKLARIAAHQLQCKPEDIVFEQDQIHSRLDPETRLEFRRLAASPHWAPGLLPEGLEPGLHTTASWTPPQLKATDEQDRINTSAAYGFVLDICGVEIDRHTGKVRIDEYLSTHDAGTIINPALADGQIRGAFAQGLGAALMEEFRYGADGSFLSGTFADYLVPTACDVPEPHIQHMETPSPFTPLGAKGLAEGNNMSTPPCLANAIADALGKDDISLPMTPEKVLRLIGFEDPAPSQAASASITAGPATDENGKGLAASGEVLIHATPEEVFDVLLDPVALARVIPGCKQLEQAGPDSYRADISIGIGMIRARYAAEIQLSELKRPHSLVLAGTGVSAVGAASGSGTVELQAEGGNTRLVYNYQAAVSGKVAAVGSRLLESAARLVLNQLFEQLGKVAGKPAQTSETVSWWRRLLKMLGLKQ